MACILVKTEDNKRERESRKNSEECKGGRLSTLQDKWNTFRSISLMGPSIETHVFSYWQAPAMVRMALLLDRTQRAGAPNTVYILEAPAS